MSEQNPLVGVLMGSSSDGPTLRHAAECLDEFGVPHEARVVSAHRTPELLRTYSREAEAGARNAALFAVRMLAGENRNLRERLEAFSHAQERKAMESTLP